MPRTSSSSSGQRSPSSTDSEPEFDPDYLIDQEEEDHADFNGGPSRRRPSIGQRKRRRGIGDVTPEELERFKVSHKFKISDPRHTSIFGVYMKPKGRHGRLTADQVQIMQLLEIENAKNLLPEYDPAPIASKQMKASMLAGIEYRDGDWCAVQSAAANGKDPATLMFVEFDPDIKNKVSALIAELRAQFEDKGLDDFVEHCDVISSGLGGLASAGASDKSGPARQSLAIVAQHAGLIQSGGWVSNPARVGQMDLSLDRIRDKSRTVTFVAKKETLGDGSNLILLDATPHDWIPQAAADWWLAHPDAMPESVSGNRWLGKLYEAVKRGDPAVEAKLRLWEQTEMVDDILEPLLINLPVRWVAIKDWMSSPQ